MTAGRASSPEAPSAAGSFGLGLLVFNGFFCAILSVLFLPVYLGSTPFPISILAAAVVNLLLVMGARSMTPRISSVMLPLMAWMLGFLLCMFGGPGGDVLLVADIRTLLLFIGAILPAAVYLWKVAMSAALAE